jgi:hypothetical protein
MFLMDMLDQTTLKKDLDIFKEIQTINHISGLN